MRSAAIWRTAEPDGKPRTAQASWQPCALAVHGAGARGRARARYARPEGKPIVASADAHRPPGPESAPLDEDRMLTPADFQAMRGAYQAIAAAAHRGHSTGQGTYCQFCDRGRGIHGGGTGQNSTRRGPMPLPAKRGQRVAQCAIDARELVPARSEVKRVRVPPAPRAFGNRRSDGDMRVRHAAHECAGRGLSRCYERLDESDLARLGRAAEAELKAFFTRNPAPCRLAGPTAYRRPRARRRGALSAWAPRHPGPPAGIHRPRCRCRLLGHP